MVESPDWIAIHVLHRTAIELSRWVSVWAVSDAFANPISHQKQLRPSWRDGKLLKNRLMTAVDTTSIQTWKQVYTPRTAQPLTSHDANQFIEKLMNTWSPYISYEPPSAQPQINDTIRTLNQNQDGAARHLIKPFSNRKPGGVQKSGHRAEASKV